MDPVLDDSSSSTSSASSSSSSSGGGSWITDHYDQLFSSSSIRMYSSSDLHSLLLKLTCNWTTIAVLIMRPETLTLMSALIILICLSMTSDVWTAVLAANFHRISRHAAWIKFFSVVKSSTGGKKEGREDAMSFFTSGLQESYQVKQGNLGIYAIRGRRAKMEDMFDYVDQIDKLGIELFGVFDGHGSDVSISHANKHTLPFLYLFLRSSCLLAYTIASLL